MESLNINHNQPEVKKATTRTEKISLRKEITKNLLQEMEPNISDNGENYIPTQYSDTLVPKFFAKCTKPRTIHFYYKGPRNRTYSLGAYNGRATSITAARKLALRMADAVRLGQDPRTVKSEQKNEITLLDVIKQFEEEGTRDWRSSTLYDFKNRINIWIKLKAQKKDTKDHIRKHYKDLQVGFKSIKLISLQDAKDLKRAIKGRYQANRVLVSIRQVLNFAVDKGYITHNPFKFEEKSKILNKEYARIDKIRPYDNNEIAKFKRRASQNISPWLFDKKTWTFPEKEALVSSLASLFEMYVGRRNRSECRNLKWADVYLDNTDPHIILKKTKTTDEDDPNLVVYLTNSKAVTILKLLRRYKEIDGHFLNIPSNQMRSRYVFPSLRNTSSKLYIQDTRRTFNKICKDAGLRILPSYMLKHTHWTTLQPDLSWEQKMVLGDWKSTKMVKRYSAVTQDIKKQIARKSRNQFKKTASNF